MVEFCAGVDGQEGSLVTVNSRLVVLVLIKTMQPQSEIGRAGEADCQARGVRHVGLLGRNVTRSVAGVIGLSDRVCISVFILREFF
jgi:hypothetical protein